MTPTDKLKRRAIGAIHDHRQVYLDPQAVLDLIEENVRLGVRILTLENACHAAHRFVQEERENRESAGGDMTDYVGEAREIEDLLAAALGIVAQEEAA